MSIITTVKDKILKNCILARILPPARIQGQKVVLARKIEKQGLGSTPALEYDLLRGCAAVKISSTGLLYMTQYSDGRI